MITAVSVCITSFVLLVGLLRRGGTSLGIPIAYLYTLLFIHVPGALTHIINDVLRGCRLTPSVYTETGIWYTAVASASFVGGVWMVHKRGGEVASPTEPADRDEFAVFCVVGGLLISIAALFLVQIPSVGAIIEKAGGVWTLGVLLGLRHALRYGTPAKAASWLAAMLIYPLMILLLHGFLSFGSTPVFVVLAGLAVAARTSLRAFVGIALVTVLFFHLFLTYFIHRDNIREAVHRESIEVRIDRSVRAIEEIEVFSPYNERQMRALDERLNQNYFLGLAAERIDAKQVRYLYGRTLWEGALALIPRIVWPDKPVYAGSPGIIHEMTGFKVNAETSYGAGNVMEFYINFGPVTVVGGFLCLGLIFGWLDRKAALAERTGALKQTIVYFLPAAIMIHPNGSLVELIGGGASAFLGALVWGWLWALWEPWSGETGAAMMSSERRPDWIDRSSR